MAKLCLACIEDESLRRIATDGATRGRCRYCKSNGATITIAALSNLVDPYLREFCCLGEMVAKFVDDSDKPDFEREGSELVDLLQEELGIEYEAAEDLAKQLEDDDPAWPGDGEEPFYVRSECYQRCSLPAWDYKDIWGAFARRIQHEVRFFDVLRDERLARILGEAGTPKADELPAFVLAPNSEVASIFRARRASSPKHALKLKKHPAKELGPPPARKASAGRMNPAGIPVFYGALSPETAVAEVRPSVGSLVVVARFAPTRELRLLDLSRMGVGSSGSIFHPDYRDREARLRFLRGFHRLIARPVQAGDEPLSYLPTQAVAEYVANVLGFDGLLYASAQVGAVPDDEDMYDDGSALIGSPGQHNVVLFGAAGKVLRQVATETERAKRSPAAVQKTAGLRYESESAEIRRVGAILYSHEAEYVHDPDEPTPF